MYALAMISNNNVLVKKWPNTTVLPNFIKTIIIHCKLARD